MHTGQPTYRTLEAQGLSTRSQYGGLRAIDAAPARELSLKNGKAASPKAVDLRLVDLNDRRFE